MTYISSLLSSSVFKCIAVVLKSSLDRRCVHHVSPGLYRKRVEVADETDAVAMVVSEGDVLVGTVAQPEW